MRVLHELTQAMKLVQDLVLATSCTHLSKSILSITVYKVANNIALAEMDWMTSTVFFNSNFYDATVSKKKYTGD